MRSIYLRLKRNLTKNHGKFYLNQRIEAILSQKTLIFDNKCINDYSLSVNKLSREIYEKEKKINDMCFSLKELLSLNESRGLVLE